MKAFQDRGSRVKFPWSTSRQPCRERFFAGRPPLNGAGTENPLPLIALKKHKAGRKPSRLVLHALICCLANSASWAKAFVSLTANSASIFRLISTPACFNPCINRL